MKTRAALMFEQPGKWSVHDVELDDPKSHEVLVRLVASGLCHSDDHHSKGDSLFHSFPFCGGHEGAGVVEAVGPDVRDVQVGDHIVTSFIPSCGRCRWCASSRQNLCDNGALIKTGCQMDGTFRMHYEGRDVAQTCLVGTFSEFSVMPEWGCIKIPAHIPLASAALLGCGAPTGWGSAVNGAEVEPGDIVIVMGVGGIGINAVQGASHAGAECVIAVDPVAMKRDVALNVGASAAFSNMDEAAELARSLSNGRGADSVILCTGVVTSEHMEQAFAATGKASTVVLTGLANHKKVGVPVNLQELALYQRRVQGVLYGGLSPARDVPRLLGLYERGILKLDELVTRTYGLDDINTGYEDMHAGLNIRGMISFDN